MIVYMRKGKPVTAAPGAFTGRAVRKTLLTERRMPMEDQKIVELFFDRSELAIEKTREKYGALCAWVAGNMLSDPQDVEECVNDAMLALWNAIPPAKPQLLGAFAARVTRNQARNRFTYQAAQKRDMAQRLPLAELEPYLADSRDVELEVQGRELTRCIERFLQTLDGESRNMFLRRYWFFDSVEQIAAGFGVTKSKVKMRLLRTRTKLREYLIQEGYINE